MRKGIVCILFPFFAFLSCQVQGQEVGTTSFLVNPRQSFYSYEREGEILLHIPVSLRQETLTVVLRSGTDELGAWKGVAHKEIIRIPVQILSDSGRIKVNATVRSSAGRTYYAETFLSVLPPKENEVKTDLATGGLIVNRRIFFPFGFYCYSPVQMTLLEEEVVKGFNMVSPYQKVLPGTFDSRKEYMDRCARLGMKVHYNLLSVSGGGGVSSVIEGITDEQKKEMLISEIKAFMDHPALLAWYISDEPTGNRISPERLEEIYRLVRELDPWHPVSIVFMAPFRSSLKYANALDIVMADPYPVPDGSIKLPGTVAGQLSRDFYGKKAVWMVPQAFGGGELWGREPTLQEIRSMTYQAIIKGARGIQYFVRHGLNSFPKSTTAWNECGRIALEIAEIAPWLLSDEEPVQVSSDSRDIEVASALHDGQLLIMAVNTLNAPRTVKIRIGRLGSQNARVIFENRTTPVREGELSDVIPALGSQVYLIYLKQSTDTLKPFRGNLIRDPGFEDASSPGIPASCYAWNEGDRGATFFTDTREKVEGSHSLRLITPTENKGTRLRFFPFVISNGKTYLISVWAKTDQGSAPRFELALGEFGHQEFKPDKEWRRYFAVVSVPADNKLPLKQNVILRMPGEGTAWFDMLQVVETTDIRRSINPGIIPWWMSHRF